MPWLEPVMSTVSAHTRVLGSAITNSIARAYSPNRVGHTMGNSRAGIRIGSVCQKHGRARVYRCPTPRCERSWARVGSLPGHGLTGNGLSVRQKLWHLADSSAQGRGLTGIFSLVHHREP